MPELLTIYDYLRANALLLGTRILEQFPALHQVHDPLLPRIEGLLRKPFPAQAIAIMGLARRWQESEDRYGRCRVRHWQDADIAWSHSCPQRGKALHGTGGGPSHLVGK
jgi:hypothetical protein